MFLFSSCAHKAPLVSEIDFMIMEYPSEKIPMKVGLFIDEQVQDFVDRASPAGLTTRMNAFEFPIGESLTEMIIGESKKVIEEVVVLQKDPDPEAIAQRFDAYIIIEDLQSFINLLYSDRTPTLKIPVVSMATGSFAEGRCDLILTMRIYDSSMRFLYDSSLTGSASDKSKALRLPVRANNFSGAINKAIQKLVADYVSRLTASNEVWAYVREIESVSSASSHRE